MRMEIDKLKKEKTDMIKSQRESENKLTEYKNRISQLTNLVDNLEAEKVTILF